ncbi:MAG: NAD-dependent epimerase/dehydratase family protein [Bacteroidales bacterium]|nr:NAD-dependent epimerase/dehydratase family protein [Bacteroidales bacterium]
MILVTGGTGLVGSHLLYALVQQNEPVKAIIRNRDKINRVKKVFAYYSDKSESLINKIDWIDGDLLDLYSLNIAFADIKKVYHCAAVVSFDGKNRNELINANVQGTENVVNLCISHQIEKLCHVSSIASLGKSLNGELIDENSKWTSSKNRSVYSESKFKSEMEVWRGIQEGLNAVIVNPSVILGPGFWNSGSGSLFTKAARGMKYYTSGATGFVDVRDVADSMIKLMESEIGAERFVLNSENLSYKELFDKIAEALHVEKPGRKATKKLLKVAVLLDKAASVLRIKKREITKEIIEAGMSVSNYSNQKIVDTINKEFLSMDKSISTIASIYKKELTIS